jgi:hypothetical protein
MFGSLRGRRIKDGEAALLGSASRAETRNGNDRNARDLFLS